MSDKINEIIAKCIAKGEPIPNEIWDAAIADHDKDLKDIVCCKYQRGGTIVYGRGSRESCDFIQGEVVDDSLCGSEKKALLTGPVRVITEGDCGHAGSGSFALLWNPDDQHGYSVTVVTHAEVAGQSRDYVETRIVSKSGRSPLGCTRSAGAPTIQYTYIITEQHVIKIQ